MTNRRKISLVALALLLSAVAMISGVMIYRALSDSRREKADFDALAKIVNRPPETQVETRAETQTKIPTKSTDQPPAPNTKPQTNTTTPKPESDPPGTTEKPNPMKRNLAPLYAQNRDFLGWLCIPGTAIDYPVMHTPNDPQKYLHRNFEGEYSTSGVPFLDYHCAADSDNLIIYGHNMGNGTVFGTLKRYTDRDYLAEHPVIEWETAEGCARYEVFTVAYVQKTDGWYGFIDTQDEVDFLNWIEYIRSKAMLTADAVPVYGRQILTLSTCHGSGKDGRLLVVAVEMK